jgi:hypothetical protein
MTARAPRAAPTPMPAFAPTDRPLCGEDGSEVELGADAVVLELTPDAGAASLEVASYTDLVELLEVMTDIDVVEAVGPIDVLVAVKPSEGTEKMVCRSDGVSAMNCPFVGLSQEGLPDKSTPQHCQSPDVPFHLTSGSPWDVHLSEKSGQILVVQLPT